MSAPTDAQELQAAAIKLSQKRNRTVVELLTADLLERLALLVANPPVEYLDEFNLPQFPDARVMNPAVELARAINGGVR